MTGPLAYGTDRNHATRRPAPEYPIYISPQIGNIVEAVITRLIGAILLEQNDEWTVQLPRHMTLETIAPLGDDALVSLPAVAA